MDNTTTIYITVVIIVALIMGCIIKCNEIWHKEQIATNLPEARARR